MDATCQRECVDNARLVRMSGRRRIHLIASIEMGSREMKHRALETMHPLI